MFRCGGVGHAADHNLPYVRWRYGLEKCPGDRGVAQVTNPRCDEFILCLWEFQTLLTGILAVIAAVITAVVLYKAARLPINAEKKRQVEHEGRRLRLHSLELSNEFTLLNRRARQGLGTIKVHVASNASVTDDTRQKMKLLMPDATRDWQFMCLVPEQVVKECVELNGLIQDHNFDIARAGGAFGADSFRDSLNRRLNRIADASTQLSTKFLSLT